MKSELLCMGVERNLSHLVCEPTPSSFKQKSSACMLTQDSLYSQYLTCSVRRPDTLRLDELSSTDSTTSRTRQTTELCVTTMASRSLDDVQRLERLLQSSHSRRMKSSPCRLGVGTSNLRYQYMMYAVVVVLKRKEKPTTDLSHPFCYTISFCSYAQL